MSVRWLSVAMLALVLAPCPATAQRLPVRFYTTADGLAGDDVRALLRDSRGFLWVGTTTGLSRFDGAELRRYGVHDGLPHPSVSALLEDGSGTLWIGTAGGLARLASDGTPIARVSLGPQAPTAILHVRQTRDRRIWVAAQHDLYMFAGPTASPVHVPFTPPNRLPPQAVEWEIASLAEGPDGDLWIGTTWGLLRRHTDGAMQGIRVRPTQADDAIRDLAFDRDGRLWITHWGIAHRPGVHFGVYIYQPPAWGHAAIDAPLHGRAVPVLGGRALVLPTLEGDLTYVTAGGPFGDARVHQVRTTPDGTIWLATENGLVRLRGREVRSFDGRNGVGAQIRVVLADEAGTLWLGTRGLGLGRFATTGFMTYPVPNPSVSGTVDALVLDRTGHVCLSGTDATGAVWFGRMNGDEVERFQLGGVAHLRYWGWGWNQLFLQSRTGEWWVPTGEGLLRYQAYDSCAALSNATPVTIYGRQNGLPADDVFRLFEDSRGDVWLSLFNAAIRRHHDTGRFERMTKRQNAPTAFADDRSGAVWMGLYLGGLTRWRDDRLEEFGPDDGVPGGLVEDLLVDASGRLWVATNPGGLARADDPSAARPHFSRVMDEELGDVAVYALAEDRQHRVYAAGGRGLYRFDASGRETRRFSTIDGLASHELRATLVDEMGQLWIGTNRGLSRLMPTPDPPRTVPRVFVDSLRVGGVPQRLSELGTRFAGPLVVEPDDRRLEIGYGSATLSNGEAWRYQTRLLGADDGWSAPTTDRSALFLNLSPGRYRFEARAVASDGLVSEEPAAVVVTILPPIWERGPFRTAVIVLLAMIAYVAYRSRVRHLLALERVRARIATDLHDDLGASLSRISILGEVAQRRLSVDRAAVEGVLMEIGESARALLQTAADIAWSIDPRRDDVGSLAARVRGFASEMLEGRQTGWSVDVSPDAARLPLAPDERRHLLLIFQEALTNVTRHARASRVTVTIACHVGTLDIVIADDGCGFERSQTDDSVDGASGRGLGNMVLRARELGGRLDIITPPTGGTRIHARIPLRRKRRMFMRW